jgi:hypothetical protein
MKLALAFGLSVAAAILVAASGSARSAVELPAGTVEVHAEIAVRGGTELRGAPAGTVLRVAPDFTGRAVIVIQGDNVVLRDFTVDGNRDTIETRAGLPPSNVPFARFTRGNGILAEGVAGIAINGVQFRHMAGFAVLVSRSRAVTIDRVTISDSGSRNTAGRNNATGGILLEEGTADFHVSHCDLGNIRGNGIWTHSLYTSPRNRQGAIFGNRFAEIGRDAIQVGHAIGIRVVENSGERIGFPAEIVDVENGAVPVALDTAGNVERSAYDGNRFSEIDGKCIDLDGFHDGEVRGNTCVNRAAATAYPYPNFAIVINDSNPDMRSQNIRILDNLVVGPSLGGIFVIGSGHRIAGNRLLDLNASHCDTCIFVADEPDMLRSGIYLGRGVAHPTPARGNVIEDNEITGYKMSTRCIATAPGIDRAWNTIRNNRCADR